MSGAEMLPLTCGPGIPGTQRRAGSCRTRRRGTRRAMPTHGRPVGSRVAGIKQVASTHVLVSHLVVFLSSHLFLVHFKHAEDIADSGSQSSVVFSPPSPTPKPVRALRFYLTLGSAPPLLEALVDFDRHFFCSHSSALSTRKVYLLYVVGIFDRKKTHSSETRT